MFFYRDNYRVESVLIPKYRNALKLFETMTEKIPDQRPDCKEILRTKHLWALSESEFDFENELKIVLDSEKEIEKSLSFIPIIEAKWIEIKEKRIISTQSINEKVSIIMETLILYESRPLIVLKCLHHLTDCTKKFCETNTDLIYLISGLMNKYLKTDIHILLNSIICLACLTKNEFATKIDRKLLEEIVELTLKVMEYYPNQQNLHINGLTILFNVLTIEDLSYDRLKCAQIVMDSLINYKVKGMKAMALSILSDLFAKVPLLEKSDLCSNPIYIKNLLDLVKTCIQSHLDDDIILEYSLSTLCILTDSCPKTSEIFIEKGGIDLCFHILNVRLKNFFIFMSFFIPIYFFRHL
jgi:hypothetical protein